MRISLTIGNAIASEPGEGANSIPARVLDNTKHGAGITLGCGLLLKGAHMMAPGALGPVLQTAAEDGTIETILAAGGFLVVNHSGAKIMSLTKALIKPLLRAQHEKGREEGREEGMAHKAAEFDAWKKRQQAAGVRFVDDNPPDEITSKE